MKQSAGIRLVMALAIADFIYSFFVNDAAHYFAVQPQRLLWVAAIGSGGGLLVFGYYKLSPKLQRRARLVWLSLAAGFVTLAGGWFSFWLLTLPAQLGSAMPHHMPVIFSLCTAVIAGFLWFDFYEVFRRDRKRRRPQPLA